MQTFGHFRFYLPSGMFLTRLIAAYRSDRTNLGFQSLNYIHFSQ